MPTRVDDRTQVLLVSLKTEARLLETWLAQRTRVAQRRTDGPKQALTHRLGLLERNVPRLAAEVAELEREHARRHRPEVPLAATMRGLGRAVLLSLAAAGFVVSLATLTPGAPVEDPLRLLAGLAALLVITLARR